MSQTFYKSRNSSLCDKSSGKCGEISFCLQVGKRVYALNCLFCTQICIQWDAFINHLEEEHDEELRSDYVLQQEIEQVNDDTNHSKEIAVSSVSSMKESPQSGRIRVRNEFNVSKPAKALLDSYDHLRGNIAGKLSRVKHSDSFECQVVNTAKFDQACDSIEEQETYDSILSLSETDSDLEATNAQPACFFQPDKLTPISSNISSVGDAEFINLNQDNTLFCRSYLQPLPSTQEIMQIRELQTVFKIDVLENKHRTRLAKELIGSILNRQPERKLFKDDFLKLAQTIVEIFPSEVIETYYVPYKTGHTAKGKLFDAYNNTRTRLRVAGLISKRFKSKPVENIALANGNACENGSIADIGESELSILSSLRSEWDLVLETWRNTHSFRQHELKSQKLKTLEYIGKYNVLLHENNYDLLDIDFKTLYPTSKNIYEWKLYYRKIIAKAEKLKDRTDVKEILKNIDQTEEEDSKLALSLMLIAYILPNPRKRTKLEIQECFISYCKDITNADEETILGAKRIKLEGQPKVYLVGDSSKTVSEAFVDIYGTRFKFKSPLKAIEVCFYCYMVMNIKYPKYVSHVWIFIQKLIYDVNTPWDSVIPAINTLINDLRLDKLQQ